VNESSARQSVLDRDRTKVAHRVEGDKVMGAPMKGAGVGAAAGERGWLEAKGDLGSRK
jgi:hypothetical protein